MSMQDLIGDIEEGNTFEGPIFVVSSKTATGKTGKEYFTAIVADKSGEYDLKAWDDFAPYLSFFVKGSFVKIKAKVGSFQSKKQLVLSSAQKLDPKDIPWDKFQKEIRKDVEILWTEFKGILNTIEKDYWKKFLDCLWQESDLERKFKIYPAAKSVHHGDPCGLLVHCLSILKILDKLHAHYKSYNLDRDLLLLGGLLHDIGKLQELTFDFRTEYTREGQLIGHLVMGSELVEKICGKIACVPDHEKILLKHIILSHHGSLEFGSPKIPMTMEAMLVHLVDFMDSKLETIFDQMKREGTSPEGWTSYNRFMDRTFYFNQLDSSVSQKNSNNMSDTSLAEVLKSAMKKL